MRIVKARWQYIERRVVANSARDLTHHGVAGEAQLAHHFADGAHHLRQIVGRNDDQRDYQKQEYFEDAQGFPSAARLADSVARRRLS